MCLCLNCSSVCLICLSTNQCYSTHLCNQRKCPFCVFDCFYPFAYPVSHVFFLDSLSCSYLFFYKCPVCSFLLQTSVSFHSALSQISIKLSLSLTRFSLSHYFFFVLFLTLSFLPYANFFLQYILSFYLPISFSLSFSFFLSFFLIPSLPSLCA